MSTEPEQVAELTSDALGGEMGDRLCLYIAIAAWVGGMIAGMVGHPFTSGALMMASGFHFGALSRPRAAQSAGEKP